MHVSRPRQVTKFITPGSNFHSPLKNLKDAVSNKDKNRLPVSLIKNNQSINYTMKIEKSANKDYVFP